MNLQAGEVMDIRLITDRHTKRSKGLAYVEYAKQEQVFLSLALSGQIMMGQPVMVKPAEAEKNLAWEAQQAAKQNAADVTAVLGVATGDAGMSADLPMKLQVTGFKAGLGEAELRQIFEPFGVVDAVSLVRDAAGQPVGIGYVVFRSAVNAQTAMQHWDGNTLLDTVLQVSIAPLAPAEGGPTTTVGELDEDEDNFKLNSQARAALMNRLAGSAGLAPPAAAAGAVPGVVPGGFPAAPAGMDPNLLAEQGKLGPQSPIPTPCLLLKGMFGPSQQTDPNWLQEVNDDVREECGKFGQLLHLHVDPESRVSAVPGILACVVQVNSLCACFHWPTWSHVVCGMDAVAVHKLRQCISSCRGKCKGDQAQFEASITDSWNIAGLVACAGEVGISCLLSWLAICWSIRSTLAGLV
jgi:RNA-binding protein 39